MVKFKKLKDVKEEDLSYRLNRFIKDEENSNVVNSNSLVPVNVPDWFDHPLVQGPRYTEEHLKWHLGHTLDYEASGVQVMGLQTLGQEMIEDFGKERLSRTYEVRGRFGLRTTDQTVGSRVSERSTWDHIKVSHIEKMLALIQGAHRNALFRSSNVDLQSEEAYQMAVKGNLKPKTFLGPIFLDVKLLEFDAPDFKISVTCMDESCQALRSLVHEVGDRLYSSAVATHVRRVQDGVFTFDSPHCLLSNKVGGAERLFETMRSVQNMILENKDSPVGRMYRKRTRKYFFSMNRGMREIIARNKKRPQLNGLPRNFLNADKEDCENLESDSEFSFENDSFEKMVLNPKPNSTPKQKIPAFFDRK